tara:strand:- start:278 stop:514 length:237 start_codon:yes stop_codon:yes gene_type:complete
MDFKKIIGTERISLSEFINFIGVDAAGVLFEVSRHAAHSYRYGYRQPSAKVAKRMMKITKGKLDFESIYGPIEENYDV